MSRKRNRNPRQPAEPKVPTQQLKSSVSTPQAGTSAAPQSKPSTEQASAWIRLRVFLVTPSWQGLGTWLGVALAVFGIVLAVVFFAAPYYTEQKKETEAAGKSVSRIDYAWFIKPAPAPGEPFEETGRWEVSIMVGNGGPLTAETIVLHMDTPSPTVFLHSAPTLMSDAAAARVEIIERIPQGIYQVVYHHLTPGDSAWVHLFYQVPSDMKVPFMQEWHKGMFSREFARKFINQFFFTGEHIKVLNNGAVELEPAFGTESK